MPAAICQTNLSQREPTSMLDDIKKFVASNLLFSLDRIIAPRLFTLVYLLGMAAIALWVMNHLFFSFRFGFGDGLWGLLEITVIAPLLLLALRIVCEAAMVFFVNNRQSVDNFNRQERIQANPNLIEDVREAIEELANADDAPKPAPARQKPVSTAASARTSTRKRPAARKATGRTARRKPAAGKKS